MSLLPNTRLLEISLETDAATRPLTELEKLFSYQMAYAAWELERVRANTHHIDAEPRLVAAQNRANCNWNRARKQLTKLQTARVNHATRLSMPKLANKGVIDHTLDLRGSGNLPREAAAVINEQEAR
jgi:hypothetical protein